MDLKEFTKETLVQIVQGVNEANIELRKHNAYVTYRILKSEAGNSHVDRSHSITNAVNVDFDVAVTTTETDATRGGGGIQVVQFLRGGIESSNIIENQSNSRIKYSIPLVLGEDHPAK